MSAAHLHVHRRQPELAANVHPARAHSTEAQRDGQWEALRELAREHVGGMDWAMNEGLQSALPSLPLGFGDVACSSSSSSFSCSGGFLLVGGPHGARGRFFLLHGHLSSVGLIVLSRGRRMRADYHSELFALPHALLVVVILVVVAVVLLVVAVVAAVVNVGVVVVA